MKPKRNRRESREIAFELLFGWSFNEYPPQEMMEHAAQARDLVPDEFTRELVERVIEHHTELDAMIESHSENWKLNRVSRVTLAALRIALCELKYFDDIPPGATINEAVELAKKYGADDEPAYLNGILGSYARSLPPCTP
ncbi:MAG: transcription antitermination factor NusB [Oscillospiraceae bacterium]|nr:transcription antitermination factor NusB [Oscillospiraceae bacterium]